MTEESRAAGQPAAKDEGSERQESLLRYYRDPVGYLASLPKGDQGVCPVSAESADPLFVHGADEVSEVLNDSRTFVRAGAVYGGQEDSALRQASYGLLSMNGDEHAMHRRPLIGYLRDKANAPLFQKAARWELAAATRLWTPGAVIDVDAAMRRVSFGTLCRTTLGLEQPGEIDGLAAVLEEWITFCLRPDNRLANKEGRVPQEAEAVSRRLVIAALDAVTAVPARSRPEPLRWLLERRDDGRIAERAFVGQIITLLTAGWETTSSALSWTLLLLAHYPEAAAELTEEVVDLGGDTDFSGLDRLPILDSVVRESLRLFPPAIAVKRVVTSTHRLRGFELSTGGEVICAQSVRHRDAEVFTEPSIFAPGRWFGLTPRHSDYFPFGLGWRRCVGERLAILEIKTVIADLVRDHSLHVTNDTVVDRRVHLALSPRDGVILRLGTGGAWAPGLHAAGDWQDMITLGRSTPSRCPPPAFNSTANETEQ